MSQNVELISCLLFANQNDEILMQHRDNIPGINSPNKVGLFGGLIELDETPEEAIVREIEEELGGYKLTNFKFYNKF